MRTFSHICVVLTAILFVDIAEGQSLSEKLLSENPTELVKQARSDGDIVRGAILFHQGNINCAKCHRPKAEIERIGPDLGKMDPTVTDEFLVEAILQPSRTIKEGYETVKVLTLDGKQITGLKVSEDQEKIVIRSSQNVDETITISIEDIDEKRPGEKSSMPDKLADELKNRQQFLDLLRYVIDIKERGPDASVDAVQNVARRQISPELNGLVLIQQMNCIACHTADSMKTVVEAKQAPRLTWSAKWLNPLHLQKFIADPHAVKPGTTMPQMLGHLNDTDREKTAAAITHFLVSKTGNEFQAQVIDDQSIPRGFELFHSVGCVACHAPRDQTAVEQLRAGSIALGQLGGKYGLDGLMRLLEDPLSVRVSGHMPNMKLSHREAIDISNYLLQKSPTSTTEWELDLELARQESNSSQITNAIAAIGAFLKMLQNKLVGRRLKNLIRNADVCLALKAICRISFSRKVTRTT